MLKAREARKEQKISIEQMADDIGISTSQLSRIETGKRQPRFEEVVSIARRLGLSVDELTDVGEAIRNRSDRLHEALRDQDDGQRQPAPMQYRPPPQFLGDNDLPVFAAVEGGPGEMVVSTDPIDVVPRPWFLRAVKDGYAVVITGESMIPAFEPGDMAIVNPRLPAIKGKHAIFISGEEHGEFRATIKKMTGATADSWHAEQYNPPRGEKRELLLPKRTWTKALRVVGKYEGG